MNKFWDLDGIDAHKQAHIKAGVHQYTWTPFPVGVGFSLSLLDLLSTLMQTGGDPHPEGIREATRSKTTILHATAGAGGSTLALASVFDNVHAGDFCVEQLDALQHNAGVVFPPGGHRRGPQVDSRPQNALDREDYGSYDVVVFEPCWGGSLYQEARQDTKELWLYPGKYQKWMFDDITPETEKGTKRVDLRDHVIGVLDGNARVRVVACLVPFNYATTVLSKTCSQVTSPAHFPTPRSLG
jgi:hypothetical protein